MNKGIIHKNLLVLLFLAAYPNQHAHSEEVKESYSVGEINDGIFDYLSHDEHGVACDESRPLISAINLFTTPQSPYFQKMAVQCASIKNGGELNLSDTKATTLFTSDGKGTKDMAQLDEKYFPVGIVLRVQPTSAAFSHVTFLRGLKIIGLKANQIYEDGQSQSTSSDYNDNYDWHNGYIYDDDDWALLAADTDQMRIDGASFSELAGYEGEYAGLDKVQVGVMSCEKGKVLTGIAVKHDEADVFTGDYITSDNYSMTIICSALTKPEQGSGKNR